MGKIVSTFHEALPVIAVDISGNAADIISNSGAQGNFVNVTGDQMTGNLTMNGADILSVQSGSNDIGSSNLPFSDIFASTLHATTITGLSPLNILADQINVGGDVIPNLSGVLDQGSTSLPFGTIYATNIIISGDQTLPTSSTDNALARFDGASGKIIQNSSVTLSDTADFSGTSNMNFQLPSGNQYNFNLLGESFTTLSLQDINTFLGSQNVIISRSDANLRSNTSGNGNIGISLIPWGNVYAVTGTFQNIISPDLDFLSGLADTNTTNVNINTSNITFVSGTTDTNATNIDTNLTNIDINTTNTSFVSGSTDTNTENITFVSGTTDTNTTNITFLSGNYLPLTGNTMTGSITLASGTDLLNEVSGINALGSLANPFSGTFTQKINELQVVASKYNEVPTGLVNGIITNFDLTFDPFDNSLRVFDEQSYVYPTGVGSTRNDYELVSGNTIAFFVAPTSGNALIAHYDYLA